jgi:dTDP-glucose 4,6-dehydratase
MIVIGSNSFSGATFIDHALHQDIEVIGISRSPELDPVFLPYTWRKEPARRFRFLRLDLNRDMDGIRAVVNDLRPDCIVNFASQSMVAESWRHPEHWFQTNVVATINLHEFLRTCDFLKRYVHISTPEVYGTCRGLVPESAPYNPSTPYAVSRAAADMSLMTYFRNYQFPVVFTRAANVFGPGQQLYRIVPRAAISFLLGKKLPLHGGGKSVRSFIHMRDVADGTMRVAERAPAGEVYHLSTTRTVSIRSVVEMIAQQMKVDFAECVDIVGERPGKDAAYLLDSAKARETLGWSDRITLEQGIEETIKWVRDNAEELAGMTWEYVHKP